MSGKRSQNNNHRRSVQERPPAAAVPELVLDTATSSSPDQRARLAENVRRGESHSAKAKVGGASENERAAGGYGRAAATGDPSGTASKDPGRAGGGGLTGGDSIDARREPSSAPSRSPLAPVAPWPSRQIRDGRDGNYGAASESDPYFRPGAYEVRGPGVSGGDEPAPGVHGIDGSNAGLGTREQRLAQAAGIGVVTLSGYVVDEEEDSIRPRVGRDAEEEERHRLQQTLTDPDADVIEGVAVPPKDRRGKAATCCGRWEISVRKRWYLAAAAIALVAVTVSASLAAVFAKREGQGNQSPDDGSDLFPGGTIPSPPSAKYKAIRRAVGRVSTTEALEDTNSPQGRALHWLANEDTREIDIEDTVAILQRYAVVTIFFATGGMESWTQRFNFLSSDHECNWKTEVPDYGYNFPYKGVVCANSIDGTTIDHVMLPGNNLTGAVPPEIGVLSGLLVLALAENELTGTIPLSVGNLAKLLGLYLDGNSLVGAIPDTIGHLQNLLHLYLDGNNLVGAIPDAIGRLQNLLHLYLDDNMLSGTIPEALGDLVALEHLSLSVNDLTGPIPKTFDQLSKLTDLSMPVNHLSGIIPSMFDNLTNLTWIDFHENSLHGTLPFSADGSLNLRFLNLASNLFTGTIPNVLLTYESLLGLELLRNNLTGTIPSQVGYVPSLQLVSFSQNHLHGTIPQSFTTLTTLTTLALAVNGLSGTVPKEIENLTSLQILELGDNSFTGPLPETMGNLTRMEFISLAGNSFTGTIPQTFARLTSLYTLDLAYNNFTGSLNFLCQNSIRLMRADCHDDELEIVCDCCAACCINGDFTGPVFGCYPR